MKRSSPGRSLGTSSVKENKPAWCSPGNSLLRTAKVKSLADLKILNRGTNIDRQPEAEKMQKGRKATAAQDASNFMTVKTNAKAPPSPGLPIGTSSAASTLVSKPKPSRAPVTDETPPRVRPLKKPGSTVVTPTSKGRKPLATLSTPKCSTPKGNTSKPSTPKASTPKASTPSGRARERNQVKEKTPTTRTKERLSDASQGPPKTGVKDKALQQFSAWTGPNVRSRKASPTPVRAPVKHLFLSPQMAKKSSKKDSIRKSVEAHGIWIGSVSSKKRAEVKKAADSEMPPPAQPTNSPEIPKRGSREASGEGVRGYFGAGPMVAPEGMGFVPDRRKCKPRGTLVVGNEGLSLDSDSSSAVDSSTQMPLPSVASVEWMMNNDMLQSMNNFQSGSSKHDSSNSLSDFKIRENLVHEANHRKDRSSQEISGSGFMQQLRQSTHNGDAYYQHARRSQAFLHHLKQSQPSRDGSFSYSAHSQYNSGDEFPRRQVQADLTDELSYGDLAIDWRQGLPSESLDMTEDVETNPEFVGSSISFASSWVPPPEENRRVSRGRSWYPPDSPWYGFSPITPEFEKASQLPDGGSKAIDALVACSVRRRIMTDENASSEKLETSATSLTLSAQTGSAGDSVSCLSIHNSQDVASSFQFATRKSYTSSSPVEMERIPQDTSMCQTASPVESSFSDEVLCQTASPINEIYSAEFNVDYGVDVCGEDRRDEELESDYEVECASPVSGDYFYADQHKMPVRSSLLSNATTDADNSSEVNLGGRVSLRHSMSRTLDELMRHNFTLQ